MRIEKDIGAKASKGKAITAWNRVQYSPKANEGKKTSLAQYGYRGTNPEELK